MKVLASCLVLVLVGLAGIWWWVDAAADDRQTDGVVVTAGAMTPTPTPEGFGAETVPVGVRVVGVVAAAVAELPTLAEKARLAEEARQAEQDRQTEQGQESSGGSVPAPAQSAPVLCWDDDGWEQCDDDEDDGDDD